MARPLAVRLHSVGFEMLRVHDVVLLLDVDVVVTALMHLCSLQVLAV